MKRFILPLFLLLFAACDSRRIYDTFSPISNTQGWEYDQTMRFEVPISDTSKLYNIYINLRHADSFPYSNLWVKVNTTFPSGKKMESRVNLPLADKSGKWYGNGSGDVITAQIPIQENAKMPENGNYRFALTQDMRVNPLKDLLDIGIRVETTE
jgi:gliding motility-associated lipoprotein GldH